MEKMIGYLDCDKGSFVLNGVAFANKQGDGRFTVTITDEKTAGEELAWLDLRDGRDYSYQSYDCDKDSLVKLEFPQDWGAVSVKLTGDGDIVFQKMF
jgi:hypothetical protein